MANGRCSGVDEWTTGAGSRAALVRRWPAATSPPATGADSRPVQAPRAGAGDSLRNIHPVAEVDGQKMIEGVY
ncbi:hypothetical protein ACF061_16510 [Streptomyces sp. NPDC015220]|uniref:hypothetical protein n=1 Tax=Streptomyces sp. NPDC015220 TaxID=3364947 RepID=UPI0036F8A35C